MSAVGWHRAATHAGRFRVLDRDWMGLRPPWGWPGERTLDLQHEPVMVNEILAVLPLRPGSVVLDGTLGLGGHSRRFAEKVAPGGTVIGLDWDESMLAEARERLAGIPDVTWHLRHANFKDLAAVVDEVGVKLDGVLFDLGLNSAQVDDPDRGFSFLQPGPLDMRMDRSQGEPASALLNRMSPVQIEDALRDYGDERWARAIAKKIVERRKTRPLRTTQDLVDAVLAAIPVGAREKRIHPATRTFQAVRLLVNRELEGLDQALVDAADRLAPGGAIAVVSYHSGEDRVVKHVFRELGKAGFEGRYRKPLEPTDQEIQTNRRSRSAKLRVLRRLPT